MDGSCKDLKIYENMIDRYRSIPSQNAMNTWGAVCEVTAHGHPKWQTATNRSSWGRDGNNGPSVQSSYGSI